MERLGELLSTHPVDNRCHLTTGVVIIVGTLLTAELGIVVAGLGVPLALVPLSRVLRGGLRERFDVHEDGIVHHARGGHRSWTWCEVATLHVRWDPRRRRLSRCVVRFSDGTRLVIHRTAVDGPLLAGTLLAQRPDAASPGLPRKWWHRA
ncbi:hypothetical protein NLX83_27575 [Allokutzneria sp. A3M-2-11 16]|uniref:hypothetical protein n=1 Tax=Allokutzneria sp. A3M-2-11 16 TaxID=2962043 RepID=UPI0020B7C171|nr:hypothetical protein [Allokutzneria sp. A3M-2-11 16]MCP3803041.1 hypothetical protein [Allokutzneria sp. A3M-2-11 16]